jgi:nucleoside-diphosphate-sugar epimerase
MNWQGVNVLVTGGASFIGSHLVDSLVGRGARVRVADDLSSGKLSNLDQSIQHVEFLEGDLRERSFADQATRDMQVVFHLAASHGGRGYIDTHPVECATNMILDGTVFNSAWQAGVERIAFASSACVYPTTLQAEQQIVEGGMVYLQEPWADPFTPGAALADGEYGWAKLMGEMALRAYHKQYGLKCVSCRYFTAYGERENETHAVIALIAKVFVGMDPYEIWGTGQQDRNFTYVGDIVEGSIRAVENVEDGSAVNIGTAEHIKVIDAARLIFQITGWSPKEIFFDTSKPVGVFSRAADLTRARSLLGWEPGTSFEDGLRRTIDWYYTTRDRAEVAAKLNVLLTER